MCLLYAHTCVSKGFSIVTRFSYIAIRYELFAWYVYMLKEQGLGLGDTSTKNLANTIMHLILSHQGLFVRFKILISGITWVFTAKEAKFSLKYRWSSFNKKLIHKSVHVSVFLTYHCTRYYISNFVSYKYWGMSWFN